MSTDLSANFNSPFGSSLAVIVRKAFDGLLMIPSRPVWIPGNHEVRNYTNVKGLCAYSVVYKIFKAGLTNDSNKLFTPRDKLTPLLLGAIEIIFTCRIYEMNFK